MASEFTQKEVIDLCSSTLRSAYRLMKATHVDILVMFVIDEHVSSWASPALEPFITDDATRHVLKTLVREPITTRERQERIALYLTGKLDDCDMDPGVLRGDDGEAIPEDEQVFIEDVDQREHFFKVVFSDIVRQAAKVGSMKSPLSEKPYEYLVLCALETGKIFTLGSDLMKPLISTEHGRAMIGSCLEINLKMAADAGQAEARQAAQQQTSTAEQID